MKCHNIPASVQTQAVQSGVKQIDLSHIPTNNSAVSRSGWTNIQQMYENVHPNLALVLLFVRTEVEYGTGLLSLQWPSVSKTKVFFFDLSSSSLS